MLEVFKDYFRTIEMSDSLQQRAERLCSNFRKFLPHSLSHAFVTDGYDDQGVRRYQNFWLFGDNLLMEFKNFIQSDNVDFVNLNCGVRWLQVEKTDLEDLAGQTSTKSRITVTLALGEGIGHANGMLQAAHNNCPYLAQFIGGVLLPHLK